jgi:hypothetical protein
MINFGRLAQLWLERFLDMEEVTRSSRVSPIKRGCVASQSEHTFFIKYDR